MRRGTSWQKLLFEEAALKPVRESGFSEETNLDEVFFKTVAAIPGAEELTKAVTDLTTFCSHDVMMIDLSAPDLTPLCPEMKTGTILAGVKKSTLLRASQVKDLLTKVQTWFNPYKGQSKGDAAFNQSHAQELAQQGEPEGLREIVGVYSQSTLYQYLKDWTINGKFLPLVAQLRDMISDLSEALVELEAAFEDAKLKSALMDGAITELQLSRMATMEAQRLDKLWKIEIEQELEELKEGQAQQLKAIEDFEAAVARARQRVQEAEKSMVESYEEYHRAQGLIQKSGVHALS